MANLFAISDYLDRLLVISEFPDNSVNGLQVESSKTEIKKVACAVDSGLSVIDAAIGQGADALLVHHGLFWGKTDRITKTLSKKIDALLSNGCSLLAYHLPLDGHQQYGNNALLAEHFGLKNIEPFSPVSARQAIGVIGDTSAACSTVKQFSTLAAELPGFDPRAEFLLDFNRDQNIKRCAIVSGSAADLISAASDADADLFISGEPKHSAYHEAKEQQVSAAFFGHYATETMGVRKLSDLLSEQFGVETFFIDQPTGI